MSPTPSRQEPVGLGPVLGAVSVPPGLEHAEAAAGDDVARGHVGAQLARHGAADQRHPGPERAHVDPAEAGTEDLHRPGRRPESCGGHLQERGLARAVRSEDHPAVRGIHPPVDAGQDRDTVAPDRDAAESDERARRAPALTRRRACDAPRDAADQARAALHPRPLPGEPEPDLTPIGQDDPPKLLPAHAGRSQEAPARPQPSATPSSSVRTASSSAPREPGPARLGPGHRLVGHVQDGRGGHAQWRM